MLYALILDCSYSRSGDQNSCSCLPKTTSKTCRNHPMNPLCRVHTPQGKDNFFSPSGNSQGICEKCQGNFETIESQGIVREFSKLVSKLEGLGSFFIFGNSKSSYFINYFLFINSLICLYYKFSFNIFAEIE